jgi:hypothetical protein
LIFESFFKGGNRRYKNLIFLISFLFIIVFLAYGFSYVIPYFSGKAIFNINANYEENQSLSGILELSLNQGELIPSSSKLILNNNGNLLEYSLNQLIPEEELIQGNFYVREKNISGVGEGYGYFGEKIVYPVVYFSLEIFSSNYSETPIEEPPINETFVEEEIPVEQETPIEEPPINETFVEEKIPVEQETPIEEPPIEESPVEEEIEEEIPVEEPPIEESPVEEEIEEEIPVEEPSATSFTGSVVSTILSGIYNFFLGLTGTGKVVLNLEKTIESNVSLGNSFSYDLEEGETAQLKKGSVHIIDSNGENKNIDDSWISIEINNESILASTTYSEVVEGFGEEYLGNKQKTIYLDLLSLNATLEQGNLSITLFYENESLVSLFTSFEQGEINTDNLLPNISIINQTIISNETNETLGTPMEFVSSEYLTDEEKLKLFDYFGNISISTEKSEIFNGRLIRKYKFGDYEIEYSYDYNGEINSGLEEQMQKDLMKWLRDILSEISKEENYPESMDALLGNYSLFENNSI